MGGINNYRNSSCNCFLNALMQALLDALELEATPQHSTFAPPSSLGDPKLDALAARIRLAVHAEITSLEGARGVKLRTLDGGTDFDVVGPEALAKLQGVFPQL